jgi:hypothetical protein
MPLVSNTSLRRLLPTKSSQPIGSAASLRTAAALLTLLTCLAPLHQANAQSFCASDGQPRPVRLMERFINADCETCWQDPATPKSGEEDAVLDWIVPNDAGSKGDDAPLSAVASRDGLTRLEVLGKSVPQETLTSTRPTAGIKAMKGSTLRVAHGLPLSGYLGTSIELKPVPPSAKKQRWTAWLALVETLPAGTEGTPVTRNLVRNAFQVSWNGDQKLPKTGQNRFFDARSMSIAQGVNPDKLRVVGWVEDAKGQVLAAAQSRCVSP